MTSINKIKKLCSWVIQKKIYILMFILIFIIWIPFFKLYTLHPWKEIANYLTMATALLAFTGTIISNMFSEYRTHKQLDKQEEQLKAQIISQKENLGEQLKAQKDNLDEQLKSQRANIKEQLYFNKQQESMLIIYGILFKNKIAIHNNLHNITTKKFPQNFNEIWNEELLLVIKGRYIIHRELNRFQKDISNLHYTTNELKKEIIEFVSYINQLEHENSNLYRIEEKNRKIFIDDENNVCEEMLKTIFKLTEEYIGTPINRKIEK